MTKADSVSDEALVMLAREFRQQTNAEQGPYITIPDLVAFAKRIRDLTAKACAELADEHQSNGDDVRYYIRLAFPGAATLTPEAKSDGE